MSVSEADRHHLYEVVRSQLDAEAADTLMNLLPPDPDRFATKDDLALTTEVLRRETEVLRGEMAQMRGELRAEMAELRTDMAELRADIAERMHEQTRTIMLANVGMWLSVAALVVGLRFT